MANHSTDFYNLKSNLQAYLDTINDEIAALEVKKVALQNAIDLSNDCGLYCTNHNICTD